MYKDIDDKHKYYTEDFHYFCQSARFFVKKYGDISDVAEASLKMKMNACDWTEIKTCDSVVQDQKFVSKLFLCLLKFVPLSSG